MTNIISELTKISRYKYLYGARIELIDWDTHTFKIAYERGGWKSLEGAKKDVEIARKRFTNSPEEILIVYYRYQATVEHLVNNEWIK